MRKLTLSALLLSSIVITACSGGGGGGDNNSAPATKLDNSGLTLSKDSFPKGELDQVSVNYKGKEVGTLSGYNRTYSFNGAFKKAERKDMEEVLVDGSVSFLIEAGANKAGAVIGGLTGPVLSYTLTSFWNATKDPTRDIFYFGYETPVPNIPKSGIVTYEGKSSRYDNVSAEVKNVGDAKLIANFDKKTIKGELDITYPRRNISLLETAIVKNGFNGKAVAEGNFPFFIDREGKYEGKFFGPNAEEVAGKATFDTVTDKSLEDLNTSFSAERVK